MYNIVLLQAAAGGDYSQFIMIGGMVVIFYLFFIRPQQKKSKDTKKFISEIKKGDQLVTVGGIHGKVVNVDENTVTIDVDRGSKLVVEKSSVSLESSKKYAS